MPRKPLLKFSFLAVAFFLFVGEGKAARVETSAVFKTSDGWTLRGDYLPPKSGRKVMVLLHGLGSSRGEWGSWVDFFGKKNGYGILRLDLRGHGDSKKGPFGKDGDYRTFLKPERREQWKRMRFDVKAAVKWLAARKKIRASRVVVVGASLGANVGIVAAGENESIAAVVALSPSADYQGVKTASAVQKLRKRPVVFLSAKADRYSQRGTRILERQLRRNKRLLVLEPKKGHGVQFLERSSMKKILAHLKKSWKKAPAKKKTAPKKKR